MGENQQDSESPKLQRAEMAIGSDLKTYYVDVVSVNVGYNGFKLTFGSVFPSDEVPKVVQAVGMVGMSAEQVKALYELLGQSLETYETKYGPIRPKPQIEQGKPPDGSAD